MTVGVVDTTVVVHLFRGNPLALAWYSTISQSLLITPISWLEAIYGAGSKEKQARCKRLLGGFELEYQTRSDLDWAMEQMERYRLSHGVGINDCLIASVCFRLQIPLYTHNVKHMQVFLPEAQVIQPY